MANQEHIMHVSLKGVMTSSSPLKVESTFRIQYTFWEIQLIAPHGPLALRYLYTVLTL